ncbi:hypothetical protein GCM10007385_23990 [Tateyamaria omphalii]|uniref:DUF1127 domain-containing protein n=1 Tax=Tateyamaria omphalii TaxID=299262 RepID=UPI0016776F35|nr:DUF1127 domain-containing protein [Tateyamaria omphalii]GGX54841.1 hypothetical protein GCM10007385_23990 [Tateyamaria omphalii]
MAYVSHPNTSILSAILDRITDFLVALGHSAAMSAAAESRFKRIEALNAKTDEELAAMNLRREDIAAYVFRDLMHL